MAKSISLSCSSQNALPFAQINRRLVPLVAPFGLVARARARHAITIYYVYSKPWPPRISTPPKLSARGVHPRKHCVRCVCMCATVEKDNIRVRIETARWPPHRKTRSHINHLLSFKSIGASTYLPSSIYLFFVRREHCSRCVAISGKITLRMRIVVLVYVLCLSVLYLLYTRIYIHVSGFECRAFVVRLHASYKIYILSDNEVVGAHLFITRRFTRAHPPKSHSLRMNVLVCVCSVVVCPILCCHSESNMF